MQYPIDSKVKKVAEAYEAQTARTADQKVRDEYFEMIRMFVLNYARDNATTPGAFSNDICVVVNGFRFAILQRHKGRGVAQVVEPLTGIVWAQETIHGDDICIRETEGRATAPWINILLRHAAKLPQEPYKVTDIRGIRNFPQVKGVAA